MVPVLTRFKSTVQPLFEFVYPPTCFICEAPMDSSNSRVCSSCYSTIKPLMADDLLYEEMQLRLTDSGHISQLISLYHFEKDGTLQSIIHQLKYDGITSLGVELGKRLGEKLTSQSNGPKIDGVVPVPLHPTKLRERGYNQSESIARGIREVTGLPVFSSLLKRHKYTSSQTKLSAVERKENVGDAFRLNERMKAEIEGKTFLIVDDVITTGATIEACAEVLVADGASVAIASSIALAEHDSLP